MSNPLVSVIIPAYNVTRYIRQAIDSALNQQFTDCEIIVINDNCPDTVNLELALNSYGSRIRYLKHPVNSGPAATRNTGIIAARGELIAFLDGDDIWESRYLETQIGVLRRHPEAHVVYCDALIIGNTKDVGKNLMKMSPSNGPVTLLSLFRQQVQVLISVLIRKEMLFKVGLLDPAFALRASEDFDLWVRIVKAGGIIIYHREQLFRYRRHAESLSSDGVRIGQSALAVASKTLKRTDLSNEERFTIEDTAARWRSDLSLEQGKRHLIEGNYRAALASFLATLDYKRPGLKFGIQRLKIIAVCELIRVVPGLLRLLLYLRREIMSFRNNYTA